MARVDRLERITNLVLVLLDASRPLTLQHLANVVPGYPEGDQARRQAFERDKRLLRAEGIPISVEPLDGGGLLGYRIRADEYYLPDLDLTPGEQVALNLAVAGVHLDDASGRDALAKLGPVHDDTPAPVAFLPALESLPRLHEALRTRSPLAFTYRSRAREVEGWGMLFRGGYWYLVGRDRGPGEVRSFRVDRMESEPTAGDPGSYEIPSDFDVSSAMPAEPWLIGPGELVEALVRFDALRAPAAVAELGEASVRERDGSGTVVLAMDVVNEDAFRSWLLGWLDHAEVVAPPELRASVVGWLRSLAGAPSD